MSDFYRRFARVQAWPLWVMVAVTEFNAALYIWRGEVPNLIATLVGMFLTLSFGPTFMRDE